LEARVHVYERTDQVDERGFYVLRKHTLVTFRFSNVVLHELRGFNEQNSLSGLDISEVDPEANEGRRIGVSFGSNNGVAADLVCSAVTVAAVSSYTPAG
jgi:hypothetical protein